LKASAANGERHPKEIKMELGRRIVADFIRRPKRKRQAMSSTESLLINKRLPIFNRRKTCGSNQTCEVYSK